MMMFNPHVRIMDVRVKIRCGRGKIILQGMLSVVVRLVDAMIDDCSHMLMT
jgi:hypothetical protein